MANRWVALVIVFVTRTSMGFQFQAVAAVAPLMVAELQLTWVQLGSLIGLYMLPGAVFALPGGVLGQRYGDRRIVVASLALMVAGGFVTAAAHGFVVAAAGRLVSGAGAVLMNILLAKMVADWFTGRELSTAMGIMLTSGRSAGRDRHARRAATHASWRVAIVATALVAALGLVLIAFVYRDPLAPRTTQRRPLSDGATLPRDRAATSGGRPGPLDLARGHHRVRPRPADRPRRVAVRRRLRRELAIWLTIVSVLIGGLITDRLGRPTLIVAGAWSPPSSPCCRPRSPTRCWPSAWSASRSARRPAP
jgi:MFS family permease